MGVGRGGAERLQLMLSHTHGVGVGWTRRAGCIRSRGQDSQLFLLADREGNGRRPVCVGVGSELKPPERWWWWWLYMSATTPHKSNETAPRDDEIRRFVPQRPPLSRSKTTTATKTGKKQQHTHTHRRFTEMSNPSRTPSSSSSSYSWAMAR